MMGNTDSPREQIGIPCVLMRGGTSKALFFHESDLPPEGLLRDRMLKRAMGTPDVLQIDGMGGSRLVTSKVAIIRRSTRHDADVDYTFVQVDVERDMVDHEGNCGNISSAVGPFAVDEKLVLVTEPVTTVRIYNTNTGKLLVSQVLVRDGRARVLGDCAIAGVPGTGSEILMDYAGTIGAKTGRLLPTGNLEDRVVMEDGRAILVSVVDVANPCVFMEAGSLDLTGCELPDALSADPRLMLRVAEVQARVGERLGWYENWRQQVQPALPLAVVVAPPADFLDVNGRPHHADDMDLRARLFFMGKCHDTMAGTGAVCLAAASRVPGTLVNRLVRQPTSDRLRIAHPLGTMEVKALARTGTAAVDTTFDQLGIVRTARRLMAGTVYIPDE